MGRGRGEFSSLSWFPHATQSYLEKSQRKAHPLLVIALGEPGEVGTGQEAVAPRGNFSPGKAGFLEEAYWLSENHTSV